MSKLQFWTLNIVGGVCALLILCNLALGQMDLRLNKSVVATQNQFNQAQRLQNTAQNLIGRIAQAGQSDAALRQLLAKLAAQIDQRKQLNQARLMQEQNRSALIQAQQLETRLQLLSLELLQVAKTNGLAKQIVQDFNIQWNPGPAAAANAAK